MADDKSTSEAGSEQSTSQGQGGMEAQMAMFAGIQAVFLKLAEKLATLTPTTSVSLVKFDPEEPDAEIEGWCHLTDIIVSQKKTSVL